MRSIDRPSAARPRASIVRAGERIDSRVRIPLFIVAPISVNEKQPLNPHFSENNRASRFNGRMETKKRRGWTCRGAAYGISQAIAAGHQAPLRNHPR
jgi:hypothetical protein